MRPPQAILAARAEQEGPSPTSFIWQSEYKREFQWRKPLVPTWEKPRAESRDPSRNGSDRSSDAGSESAASAFTTAMETLRDSRDSLARHRPGAAHPAHRKHVNSPAPSIQEEYKNVVESFTRPKSAAWSEATASGSSTPNLVGGRGLTRPYSPAASSRASSVDMQEEMDRRYGRKVSRPSSSSSRQFEPKEEMTDTRSTSFSKTAHNDKQHQQQPTTRVNLTKNIPYQPLGVARLRSPPSSVGSLDDYMNQDSASVASLKAKTAKALLNSRIEGYQTEYQRQFQDWTEKIYGAKRDVRFSPSIATVQRTRAIPAAAEDDGVKYGILGNRVNDRESNIRAFEEGSNRRTVGRNEEMGENSRVKVEHRLKAENLPAAGVAAYRGVQSGTNSSGRKKYESGRGIESVAALMTHNENVDPHRVSKEGLKAKDSYSNRGGNRILLYSVEPPPTWNLAQEILQKARQRRHEFLL
ncbi:hypothetical protein HDU81_003293 [Chytriomyces hyalinus]|nr:hypothetical protein HDU81_003293 [Chytriomyces hyalinus]